MTDYSQLTDEEIQTELEKGYRDIQEGKCAYVDEAFENIRKNIKTDEEMCEREMMQELAEFVFRFGDKYNVLLDIKVKPRKYEKNNSEREDDVDEN